MYMRCYTCTSHVHMTHGLYQPEGYMTCTSQIHIIHMYQPGSKETWPLPARYLRYMTYPIRYIHVHEIQGLTLVCTSQVYSIHGLHQIPEIHGTSHECHLCFAFGIHSLYQQGAYNTRPVPARYMGYMAHTSQVQYKHEIKQPHSYNICTSNIHGTHSLY